jgi:hypothetical protein
MCIAEAIIIAVFGEIPHRDENRRFTIFSGLLISSKSLLRRGKLVQS